MKRLLFKILIVIIIFYFTSKIITTEIINKEKNNIQKNFRQLKSVLFDLDEEKTYKINFDINVNNEPTINGADYYEFNLKRNTSVSLIQLKDDFAKIKYNNKEGWVPAWYLTIESSKIIFNEPYLRIVDKPASQFLYPNAQMPKYNIDLKLEKGKIVKIIATHSDWFCVKFIRYDNPEYDLTWIKKEYTVEYNSNLVKEGYLKKNAKVYTENGYVKNDIIDGYVKIQDETNKFYYAIGCGGQEGYIKKNDFIPIDLNCNFE